MWQWQDIVISVVSFSFGFMLFPQLKDVIRGTPLNQYTAGLTTAGLYLLGCTFITLSLWFSAASEFFAGTIWLLLFIFSFRNSKKTR
jgi:hypothetical protein